MYGRQGAVEGKLTTVTLSRVPSYAAVVAADALPSAAAQERDLNIQGIATQAQSYGPLDTARRMAA